MLRLYSMGVVREEDHRLLVGVWCKNTCHVASRPQVRSGPDLPLELGAWLASGLFWWSL
jgi:hypothetical protein